MSKSTATDRTSQRVERITPTETLVSSVPVDDGSPWSIELLASCHVADVVRNIAPCPKVNVSIRFHGKHVESVEEIGLPLLNETWPVLRSSAAAAVREALTLRGILFPDPFQEGLKAALEEARKNAILCVIRYQAASLIHLVPSSDACAIWATEEAKFVMSA